MGAGKAVTKKDLCKAGAVNDGDRDLVPLLAAGVHRRLRGSERRFRSERPGMEYAFLRESSPGKYQ
jgi:hypothetical protein